MKRNCLKYGALIVFLLTQNSTLAHDTPERGKVVSSPKIRVRGKRLNQLSELQMKVREMNREFHSLMDDILSNESAMERTFLASRLTGVLRAAYTNDQLKKRLDEMEDLVRNEMEPTNFRRMALDVLGEYSIPNSLIRSLLEFVAGDGEDPLAKDAKETLSKLKAAQAQTGQKLSDLLAYSRESGNIREAVAFIWIAIYEDEQEGDSRLLKWFSNDELHKKQIGLLIAEELERRGETNSRSVRNAIRRLRKQAKEEQQASLALTAKPFFMGSEGCDSNHFNHGAIPPRVVH